MFRVFLGGVHPKEKKESTKDKPIRQAKVPLQVTIPMIQHTGAPCEPVVKVGDMVNDAEGRVLGSSRQELTRKERRRTEVIRLIDTSRFFFIPLIFIELFCW